jgi:hypothetical protein
MIFSTNRVTSSNTVNNCGLVPEIQCVLCELGAYCLEQERLTSQVERNMLLLPQCYFVRGDIWKEKTAFNPFRGNSENYELCICMEMLYILWTVHRDTRTWESPTRCTLFLIFYFTEIILDMFRTSNSSSSGGVLYKQITVFHQASYEESSRWHGT